MRHPPSSFQTSVRAYRALTAAPADGAATRARVLARAGRGRSRGASWRRLATLVIAITAVSVSASAAWTRFAPAWRAAPVIVLRDRPEEEPNPSPRRREPSHPRAVRAIPVAAPDALAESTPGSPDSFAGEEARAYARAHRAHFVDESPARALAAWTEYLRRYPRGALAPEAQFNRALCLVHLGRFDEATRALRTFTAVHRDGYRRADVEKLLGWLRDQTPAR